LIHYRNFIEAKTPVISEKNDGGVMEPSKDKHLYYLLKVQEQLNAQEKVEPDPIVSVIPAGRANQYTRAWEEWQRLYMTKK